MFPTDTCFYSVVQSIASSSICHRQSWLGTKSLQVTYYADMQVTYYAEAFQVFISKTDITLQIEMTGTFSINTVTIASQRSLPDGNDTLGVCACMSYAYILKVIGIDTREIRLIKTMTLVSM